jgi:hypothetical protein
VVGHPGEQAERADLAADPAGDQPQQLGTGGVSVGLAGLGDPLEVDEQHGGTRLRGSRTEAHRVRALVHERGVGRQAGEVVAVTPVRAGGVGVA